MPPSPSCSPPRHLSPGFRRSSASKPPVDLDEVLLRRGQIRRASRLTKWTLANLAVAAAILLELRTGALRHAALSGSEGDAAKDPPGGLVLSALLFVFLANAAVDLWNRLFPRLSLAGDPVVLSARQMRLLRVSQEDPGFKLAPESSSTPKHPNPFSPPLEGSFVLPPTSSSPVDASHNVSSLDSSSWVFHDAKKAAAAEAAAASASPNQRRSVFNSSVASINDEDSLMEYLEEFGAWQKQRDNSNLQQQQQQSPDSSQSFWRPVGGAGSPSGVQDYSPILNRLSYQLSTPMPGSKGSLDGGGDGTSGGGGGLLRGGIGGLVGALSGKSREDICYRVGIEPLELVAWMENIRLWISQTVLVRLVAEVDETNRQLAKLGLKEVLVGEAGLEKVKKASRLPHVFSAVPSLHKLLPFLELTPHQDYLVDRVRQLARGGAMSEYRWSGGGRHRGAEWAHERGLPADAELVMHCVAAYFDARLPPAEGVIDGRVFSTLHLFKEAARGSAAAGSPSPSSTNAPMVPQPGVAAESAKELSARLSSPSVPVADFAIVQTIGRPSPHFYLRLGEGPRQQRLEVGPGRNNLFHTLLLFLYHVKTKEHGILGRINLGRSGLNVLWVIE